MQTGLKERHQFIALTDTDLLFFRKSCIVRPAGAVKNATACKDALGALFNYKNFVNRPHGVPVLLKRSQPHWC